MTPAWAQPVPLIDPQSSALVILLLSLSHAHASLTNAATNDGKASDSQAIVGDRKRWS